MHVAKLEDPATRRCISYRSPSENNTPTTYKTSHTGVGCKHPDSNCKWCSEDLKSQSLCRASDTAQKGPQRTGSTKSFPYTPALLLLPGASAVVGPLEKGRTSQIAMLYAYV